MNMVHIAAVALSLVLVTACGKADSSSTQGASYLETLHKRSQVFNASDQQLVAIGHQICTNLDRGYTFHEMTQIIERNGFSSSDAGYLVGAAIGEYCPEYIKEIN